MSLSRSGIAGADHAATANEAILVFFDVTDYEF